MNQDSVVVELPTERATERLGQALANAIHPPMVVAINGTLGAGKTHLTRAICHAWKVPPEEVTSPSYVLLQRYRGQVGEIYHLDFYRLRHADEVFDLGIDEIFEQPCVVFIEWAEKFLETLPEDHLTIDLHLSPGGDRRAKLHSSGPRSTAIVHQLRAAGNAW
ncbi:MAG: tRNA (adenosine(37)-N6)-threonylcarbamoyltransferase complex ATPase subunit type 1 TsaE [Pirellulaceae bacterium]|nr:MAG: tRNA (adenosine(37)-N6)-threonylcarbamoyltransferase complex ATPase subunit type 1 TsaE [Pirellulaceae bacterium]